MEIEVKQEKPHLTVKEFRMWLEGVIEMQDEDWVPDARQWKRILGKIYDIADVPSQHQNFTPSPMLDYPVSYRNETIPAVQAPVSYQMAPSGLNATAPRATNLNGPFAGDNGQVPVRTPNIDTTTGYDTPFA